MFVRSPTVLVVRMTKRDNQAPNNSWTSDFSSFNSFTLASIFPRLNPLIGTFCTYLCPSIFYLHRKRANQTILNSIFASGTQCDAVPILLRRIGYQ